MTAVREVVWEKVVCPECNGFKWVAIDLWHHETETVTTTRTCPWCEGRGYVWQEEGDGMGYERRLA